MALKFMFEKQQILWDDWRVGLSNNHYFSKFEFNWIVA